MFDLFTKIEPVPCTVVIQGLDKKVIMVIDQDDLGGTAIYSFDDAENFLIDIGCFEDFELWDDYATSDCKHNVFWSQH